MNIQKLYTQILEGKGNKDFFMKNVRRIFPQYTNQYTSFDEAVHILKNKQLLFETVEKHEIDNTQASDWSDIFKQNMSKQKQSLTEGDEKLKISQLSQLRPKNKVKYLGKDVDGFKNGETYEVSRIQINGVGTSIVTIQNKEGKKLRTSNLSKSGTLNEVKKKDDTKPDKEVLDIQNKQFDNKNDKNIDNVYGNTFLNGYYTEMKDPENKDKTVDELKEIVRKNLDKDINFYTKEGMFGTKGIGTKTSTETKVVKGKFAGTGMEEVDNKSTILKESLNENGIDLDTITSQMYKEYKDFKGWPKEVGKDLRSMKLSNDQINQILNNLHGEDYFDDSEVELNESLSYSDLEKGKEYLWNGGADYQTVTYIGLTKDNPDKKPGSSIGKGFLFLWGDGTYFELGNPSIRQNIEPIEDNEDLSPMDRMYDSDEWVQAQRDEIGLDENTKMNIQEMEKEYLEDLVINVIPTLDEDEVELYVERYGLTLSSKEDGYNIEGEGITGSGETALEAFNDWAEQWIYENEYEEDGYELNENTKMNIQEIIRQVLRENEEKDEPTQKVSTVKKPKKDDVLSRLKKFQSVSEEIALESNIEAIMTEIERLNGKIQSAESMDEMQEFVDPVKIKKLQKEVVELEKAKGKLEKILERKTKGKKKIVTDTPTENQNTSDDIENNNSDEDYEKAYDSMEDEDLDEVMAESMETIFSNIKDKLDDMVDSGEAGSVEAAVDMYLKNHPEHEKYRDQVSMLTVR